MESINCANCSKIIIRTSINLKDLRIFDQISHKWLTVSVFEIFLKVFKINLNELEDSKICDNLHFCATCRNYLRELYKFYTLFIQIGDMNSKISRLFKSSKQNSSIQQSGSGSVIGAGTAQDYQTILTIEKEKLRELTSSIQQDLLVIKQDPLIDLDLTKIRKKTVEKNHNRSNPPSLFHNTSIITATELTFGKRRKETTGTHLGVAENLLPILECSPRTMSTPKVGFTTTENYVEDTEAMVTTENLKKPSDVTNTISTNQTFDVKPTDVHAIHNQFVSIANHKSWRNEVHNPTKCSICLKIFKNRWDLKLHILGFHQKKKLKCKLCNVIFYGKSAFENHKISKHPSKLHSCTICSKVFKTRGTLLNHLNLVIKLQKYKCTLCENVLCSKEGLIDHKRTHTGSNLLSCIICKKAFVEPDRLRIHFKGHFPMLMKTHKCEICEKFFGTRSHLMRHKLIHMEEPALNFTCELCGDTFSTNNNLKRHKGYHRAMDEMTYNCTICVRCFPSKNKLNYHLKTKVHNLSRMSQEKVLESRIKKELLAGNN